MEQTIIALWITTAILIAGYTLALITASKNFDLTDEHPVISSGFNDISVVIPFRNEAAQMNELGYSLKQLDSAGLNVEFILVNDHSTDEGRELITKQLEQSGLNARIIDLGENDQGKKAAIRKGIADSRYEVIATLDADCRPGRLWLKCMLNSLHGKNLLLLTGPVRYASAQQSVLTVYQQMENAVFMALTKKQFAGGSSLIANGANMCFKKQGYLQAESIRNDKNIAGGDDIFLLEAFEKLHPGRTGFADMRAAMVETDAEKSWKQLFEQRTRWAAKVRFQNKPGGLFWQTMAFTFSLLYAGCILLCAAQMDWITLISIVVLKSMSDVFVVRKPARYLNYSMPIILQATASFIQPFFILAVGCKARFGRFNWKGRVLKA